MTADRDHDPVPADDLDVDELMRQVRKEVEDRGVAPSPPSPQGPARPRLDINGAYDLVDFLALEDEELISAAYQGILHREPDEGGRRHFLDLLRAGSISKVEVLGRLRYSPEGRLKRVSVRGLGRRYALETAFRLPLVGRFLALGRYLLRRPRVAGKLEAMEVRAARKHLDVKHRFEALAHDLLDQSNETQTQRDLDALAESLHSGAEAAEIRRHLGSLCQRLQGRAEAVDQMRRADAAEFQRQLTEQRCEILAQQRQISGLVDALMEGGAALGDDQARAAARESERSLDGFYTSFENVFRGTREEVKRRCEPYLSFVRSAGAGTGERAVLDLGCGRGEWLEVLREQGLGAKGLDTNRVTIEQCREAGLDVVEGDAMAYLRGLSDASLGAVTGFHIIEHIPFADLVRLIDDCLRVLKPGGVAIFETPNPENLVVGSCSFYYDPTHLNPLPPALSQFLLEARGFESVEILRLTADRAVEPLPRPPGEEQHAAELKSVIEFIDRRFGAAPDYAVIGYKP